MICKFHPEIVFSVSIAVTDGRTQLLYKHDPHPTFIEIIKIFLRPAFKGIKKPSVICENNSYLICISAAEKTGMICAFCRLSEKYILLFF